MKKKIWQCKIMFFLDRTSREKFGKSFVNKNLWYVAKTERQIDNHLENNRKKYVNKEDNTFS